jgi:hypothetical protein
VPEIDLERQDEGQGTMTAGWETWEPGFAQC